MNHRGRPPRARPRDRSPRADPRAPSPAPPLALRHPAAIAAAVVAAACVAAGVTFRLSEPDVWQHLLVGRVIWQTRSIPGRQIWCWPTYGTPQALPSWGFRALLWPFYAAGGITGLFVWRWLTSLVTFAVNWVTARRMGAKGLSPLVVMAVAALTYRHRSQVRPETLVGVLLAVQIWILETRRRGRPDRAWWLVVLACVWANVHLSYVLGLLVLACYAVDETLAARGVGARGAAPARGRARLWLVLGAATVVSFLNPFGWRALWQPFEFYFTGRHELIFQHIGELRPIEWRQNLADGLPLVLAAWALLLLRRMRRQGPDAAAVLLGVSFATIGLLSQRFLGLLVIAISPFLARDLDAWVADHRWPSWSASAGARAALAAVACVLASLAEWSNPTMPLGVGVEWVYSPVAGCDFMQAQAVAGRGFNPFHFGGYLLWRFWPDPGRLPFMDIHQTGGPVERRLAAASAFNRDAYRTLQQRYAFDWALLDRRTPAQARLLDWFDRDSSWVPVFMDDAAALFVREDRFRALGDRFGYRAWPAGWSGLDDIAPRLSSDAAFRAAARAELERQAGSSRWNSVANNFLANLDLIEHRDADARRHLEAALAVDPRLPAGHERLGRIALRQNRPADAAREFARELALHPENTAARAALRQLEPER